MCIQGKLKLCKFPLKASVQKSMQNFLKKNGTICFILSKAFQRALKCQNPRTGSGSKYRFSLVKVKLGIQAVGIKVPG